MEGRLYRRYANGCIYEVIDEADRSGTSPKWILWNDRFAERLIVPEVELSRQVGWDLVGDANTSDSEDTAAGEVPAALIK